MASESHPVADRHWAYQALRPSAPPVVQELHLTRTILDRFVQHGLEARGLALAPETDRRTLIRRVSFTVTGLPPSPEEIQAFVQDTAPDALDRMIERYLASPRYGERWGKHWLDAAGYADSNGYFAADTDRPLAYRYRDYVIRSLNRDKPFDQFVREQLAGDELSGWQPGQPASPEILELLEATHFLRNGQDGSGESDGNPDEVRVDRYYALESTLQVLGSCLLGVTVQCAKCHDHKFEPFTQQDYYALQAVFYPAFNLEKWVKPNDRFVHAYLPGELEAWEAQEKRLDAEQASLKLEFSQWIAKHRPRGDIAFEDRFDAAEPLASRWSNIAPGDDTPGGKPPVQLDTNAAPAAYIKDGALRILESGTEGDRWISTQQRFDWRPPNTGDWIQVTFDLVATRLDGEGKSADRVAYLLALHDFNDNCSTPGGNILIDGNPGGSTTVHVDYPGTDSQARGNFGTTGYKAGHEHGTRITRQGDDEFTLEHLVDGTPDGPPLKLRSADLPPGGFGFEYCCGRSFVVDNVVVEVSKPGDTDWVKNHAAFERALRERKESHEKQLKALASQRSPKPGKIAWVTDVSAEPPTVRLLKRGSPKTPGDPVEAGTPAFLGADKAGLESPAACGNAHTTGRRLAWARWLTTPGSPQAALLARVTINRVWQRYFGTGLVSTPDNLGRSGAAPSNPELLEWLTATLIESGWSLKSLHRQILRSAVFGQSSAARQDGLELDPDNHGLWRYPLRRLDAEAIRDAMLETCGRLGAKTQGPYVPTTRQSDGEIVVEENQPEAFARSVFLQQRRTQVPTFLGVFDAPSMVFNCTERNQTTMPLQSLSLLNSDFAVRRAKDLAARLERDCGTDGPAKLERAFVLACGRSPAEADRLAAQQFLEAQQRLHSEASDAAHQAWADFCQALLASNEFLYLE